MRTAMLGALLPLVWACGAAGVKFRGTWYGAKDNCPPGGDIAYPVVHKEAGGVGTWEDPVTFAGVPKREAPGTRIYVPVLQKYFVMEDECEECIHDWRRGVHHIDLWMGPSTAPPGPGLIECENAMTRHYDVVLSPNRSLPVDPTPVFDVARAANNGCTSPVEPCHDRGSQCGNSCEIPDAASCAALARLFALSTARFAALNPGLDCTRQVPQGRSVCMGGTCGD